MPRNCGAQDATITNVEKITTTNEKGPFESAASINQEKTKVRNEETNMILILRLPSMVEAARVKHIKAGHASTEIKSRFAIRMSKILQMRTRAMLLRSTCIEC